MSVWASVPNPEQCFRCQKFGHIQQHCTLNIVCGHCNESSHNNAPCMNCSHCVNCGGNHLSIYKKCLVFIDEKNIQELKVNEGLMLPEARRFFLESEMNT